MALFSNRNIVESRHRVFPFTGRWLDSFGCPSVEGSWIIYGGSGSGKTSFALQAAKYLTGFSRVLYWSIEQGNSAAFRKSWLRENMQECGTRIAVIDSDELSAEKGDVFGGAAGRMLGRSGYDVLLIDSLTPLRSVSFSCSRYESLRKRLKGKLLIWISHEKNGLPDTSVGDYIMKLSDLKIRVEGFKAFVNSRSGDRMKDFVIWESGASEYYADK